MENRNKTVECDKCLKKMRSDDLHCHKLAHKDLLSLPDDQIRVELEARQAMKERQEAKVKRIKEIARENNLSIPEEMIKRVNIENVHARRSTLPT
jgi:Rps23 Pro-64 3,4-dihydroxylase Tpa1-like proline 4-hydroxylase